MMYHPLFLYAAVTATELGITKISGDVVKNALTAVYFWAAAIAVIIIVIAGFYYVTSNGNAQQVTRAKNAILGAVVGLIVILSAFAITRFVLAGVS